MLPVAVLAALVGAVLFLTPRNALESDTMKRSSELPRGIRNNNPGNIRHGDNWQGMAAEQPDRSFITFVNPVYGFRAMTKILQSYRRRGVTTVADIIATWAPPVGRDPETGETYGNHTAAYVQAVASRTGLKPEQNVDLSNRPLVVDLLAAMTLQENGQQPYSLTTIREGYDLA